MTEFVLNSKIKTRNTPILHRKRHKKPYSGKKIGKEPQKDNKGSKSYKQAPSRTIERESSSASDDEPPPPIEDIIGPLIFLPKDEPELPYFSEDAREDEHDMEAYDSQPLHYYNSQPEAYTDPQAVMSDYVQRLMLYIRSHEAGDYTSAESMMEEVKQTAFQQLKVLDRIVLEIEDL